MNVVACVIMSSVFGITVLLVFCLCRAARNGDDQMRKVISRRPLSSDVCRCLGDNCPVRQNCLRWLGRNDQLPMLTFIATGEFINGVCSYWLKEEDGE